MRAHILVLITIGLTTLSTHAQPRGDLIGEAPAPATKTVVTAPARPAATSVSAQTNATELPSLGFNQLADYDLALTDELQSNTNRPAWADAKINDMIPAKLRAYDGKKVAVEGFLIPTDFDAQGKMTEFIVSKNQMSCCYGGPTAINEFVAVKVIGPPVKSTADFMDYPVRVKGALHVGAHRENGYLNAVYRMEAESISVVR